MDTKLLTGIASLLLPLGGYSVGQSRVGTYQAGFDQPGYLKSYSQRYLDSPLKNFLRPTDLSTPHKQRPLLQADANDSDITLSQGQVIRELVIIDGAVADKSALLRGLQPGIEAVEINVDTDGLQQLTAILSAHSDLSAVHVVSHADSGMLALGNSRVNAEHIQNQSGFYDALNHAVRAGGDILFYGCNLAAGEQGEAWLDIVSANTDVDIAASNNLTGNSELAGDWTLEIAQGDIEATLPFSQKALRDFRDVLAVTAYTSQGFYDANSGGLDYFHQTSLTSGDGQIVLSAPGYLVSAFGGLGTHGASFAYNIGTGDYYGMPFQVAADGTSAATFELHNLILCNDTGSLGPATPLTINLTVTGYYSNNASAGSSNVSVTTLGCAYGANLNDVDTLDMTATFGSGKDLARVRIDYNGAAPNDKYLVFKSVGVDNIKAPVVADVTAPQYENSTPSVDTITFSGATLNADLDEDGTVYYVVVPDAAAAPSVNQVKAGQNSASGAALASGNFTTTSTTGSGWSASSPVRTSRAARIGVTNSLSSDSKLGWSSTA